jgi:hypothetical protein
MVVVALAVPACAQASAGPTRPIAQEQVGGADGIDVASARATALAFLSAYADSPAGGVAPLAALVGGGDLHAWVKWLGVQNREFDGAIDGAVELRSAAFTASVPVRDSVGAQVDMSASVTFTFTPANGDQAFERTRILDGPITLLQMGIGDWNVVDVTRDGVSMDAGITRFKDEIHRLAGVGVRLDSVFRFVPNWQFNVVVTNDTASRIGLDPARAALLVHQPGGVETISTVPSRSLRSIPPGSTVEALIAVPYQDSAERTSLSLPFVGSDGSERRFTFDLAPIMGPSSGPSTGSGSVSPVPS